MEDNPPVEVFLALLESGSEPDCDKSAVTRSTVSTKQPPLILMNLQ
jgi:hypothetical protein